MTIADWIAIAIVLGSIVLGIFVGFGSGLKFFTSGVFGFIIGLVVCAMFGTVFLDVGFIGDMLAKLAANWADNELLTKMHLEVVIYYVALFFIVQLLRIIIVLIIKKLLEADKPIAKIINKTLGAILFLGLGILFSLLVFKIIGWVNGPTAESLYDSLKGSLFNLDGLFDVINPGWKDVVPDATPEDTTAISSLLLYLS